MYDKTHLLSDFKPKNTFLLQWKYAKMSSCWCTVPPPPGGQGGAGGVDQWEAGIWSCDLRANERPRKKMHSMAQTHRTTEPQTHRRTWRLYDQLGPVGPSWWKLSKITAFQHHLDAISDLKYVPPGYGELYAVLQSFQFFCHIVQYFFSVTEKFSK